MLLVTFGMTVVQENERTNKNLEEVGLQECYVPINNNNNRLLKPTVIQESNTKGYKVAICEVTLDWLYDYSTRQTNKLQTNIISSNFVIQITSNFKLPQIEKKLYCGFELNCKDSFTFTNYSTC